MMPSAEEAELLRAQEGGVNGGAERFLLLMAGVPRLRQRLICFQAKMNFDSRVQDAEAQVRTPAVNARCA
eukprot:14968-Prymnesium_polylepis.2